MPKKITYTIDVEPDLHSESQYKGITEGLVKFEKICDKNNVKPILFVTCDCIKKYPQIFRKLHEKGWEISLHAYEHKRFDELSSNEKEEQIKKSLACFKKYLKIKPKGFRAPQHGIDAETLALLEKYNFEYDSSYHPMNLLQLLFFPKKFSLWLNLFFSPRNPYKIRKNLIELPPSALIFPCVSLAFRMFPVPLLRLYLSLIRLFHKKPMFYAHSWDFIELKESRIDRAFSHAKLLNKLDIIMGLD